jgi:hypothetical protein
MSDILLAAREEVVDAKNVAPLFEQTIDEMGAEEPRSSGHQHAFPQVVQTGHQPSACFSPRFIVPNTLIIATLQRLFPELADC